MSLLPDLNETETIPPALDQNNWKKTTAEYYEFRTARQFFVSEDLIVGNDTVITPVNSDSGESIQEIEVWINRGDLPPDSPNEACIVPEGININGRSRLTQAGLEPTELSIYPYNNSDSENTKYPNKVKGSLKVKYFGKRNLEIGSGEGVAYMFRSYGANMLKGDSLNKLTNSDLDIAGQDGDWILVDDDNQAVKNPEKAKGILFRVTSLQTLKETDTPINLTNPTITSDDFRTILDSEVLQKVHASETDNEERFIVGETAIPISFPENIFGVVEPEIMIMTNKSDITARHLFSRVLQPGRKWPIRVEIDTENPINIKDIQDVWVKIKFFRDYHQEAQPINSADKLQIEKVPENDPRIEKLSWMLRYLENIAINDEKFPIEPVVVHYSTSSNDKQLAALAIANRDKRVFPIFPLINQSQSVYQALEIDAQTGLLDVHSINILRERYRITALMSNLFGVETSTDNVENYIQLAQFVISENVPWNDLSLSEKAEWQAKLKAIQHESITGSNDQVIATDYLAQLPDGTMLGKTTDPKEQRQILEKIAKAGTIQVSIGIAYTRLLNDSWPVDLIYRLSKENMENLVSGHVNCRIQLSKMTTDDIQLFIDEAAREMAKSGSVIDVFGEIGSRFVRKIQIEDNETGKWREAKGENAWTTIVGYPAGGIYQVLQTAQNEEKLQSKSLRTMLEYTYMTNKQLLNQLQGKPQLEKIDPPDFPENLVKSK
ncbi:hypothetical protein ACFL1A_02820 [Patescibacteria group bacterium]